MTDLQTAARRVIEAYHGAGGMPLFERIEQLDSIIGASLCAGDHALEDEIADAIDDSLDMDWTGKVGARAVMALLRSKGLVA